MKKLCLLLVVLVFVGVALADGYRVVTFQIENVNTNTTVKTHTVKGVTGKALYFAYSAGTNMTVTLATVAGYGLSTATAKALWTPNATNDVSLQVAVPGTVYLGNDRVVLSAHSADTNAVASQRDIIGRLPVEE